MADRKAFFTDEACALALLNREIQEAINMSLSDETTKVLGEAQSDIIERIGSLAKEWVDSMAPAPIEAKPESSSVSTPEPEIETVPADPVVQAAEPTVKSEMAPTPPPPAATPNTSSMPDSTAETLPTPESVTP